MKSRRSHNRAVFECRACGARIHPAAYRAACPDCGGALRVTADAGRS